MATNNKYIVTWDIQVNSNSAIEGVNSFVASLKAQNTALSGAITRLKNYNAELIALKKNLASINASGVGSQSGGAGGRATPPAYVLPNVPAQPKYKPTPTTKPNKPKGSSSGSSKVRIYSSNRGYSAQGFKSPIAGTPIGGIMGTMLAYTALASNVKEAVEYDNLITTSREFLKSADDDLTTFEARFSVLAKNVRQVGLETKFTAKQVADATRFLAMAGLNTNMINQSIKPIADLAIIGDAELGLVADLGTNIMTGYGLSDNAMGDVADIMTSVMTRSNVTIQEMAESFKMASGYLSSAGIEFTEAASAIGVLGDAGMKATLAGTALRAMMIRFAKPTAEAKRIMNELGVTFTQTVDVMGKKVSKVRPLYDIFTELKEKGASLEDLQRMFGVIGGNASLQLINRTDKLKALTEVAEVSFGVSDKLSNVKKETVEGLYYQMTSMFKDKFILGFESIKPVLSVAMKSITEGLNDDKMVDGLSQMGRALASLLDIVSRLGIWVAKNWSWLQPLLITKVIHGNLMNLGRGVTKFGQDLVDSLTSVGNAKKKVGDKKSGGWIGSMFSGMAGGWIGLATTATVAIGSYLYAQNYAYEELVKNNNLILEESRKKIPNIIDTYDDWIAKINELGKSASQAKTSIENMQTVGSYTGMSADANGSFWGVGKFDRRIEATKMIETVANKKTQQIKESAESYIEGIDFTKPNAIEDILKTSNVVSSNLSLNDRKINYGLYEYGSIGRKPMTIFERTNDKYKPFFENDDTEELPEEEKERANKAYLANLNPVTYKPYRELVYTDLEGNKSDSWNIDKMPIKDIVQTIEYNKFLDDFMPNYFARLVGTGEEKGTLSYILKNQDNVLDFALTMVKSNKEFYDYLKQYGIIIEDGKGGVTFNSSDSTLPTSIGDQTIMRSFSKSIIDNQNETGGVLSPTIMVKLLRMAGLPEWLVNARPINNNTTGVASIIDKDEVDEKIGSKRGISGNKATPRQVIINMDNLMKIDNVEINNENMEMELSDLKAKVRDLLLDIMSDTANSFHGAN